MRKETDIEKGHVTKFVVCRRGTSPAVDHDHNARESGLYEPRNWAGSKAAKCVCAPRSNKPWPLVAAHCKALPSVRDWRPVGTCPPGKAASIGRTFHSAPSSRNVHAPFAREPMGGTRCPRQRGRGRLRPRSSAFVPARRPPHRASDARERLALRGGVKRAGLRTGAPVLSLRSLSNARTPHAVHSSPDQGASTPAPRAPPANARGRLRGATPAFVVPLCCTNRTFCGEFWTTTRPPACYARH